MAWLLLTPPALTLPAMFPCVPCSIAPGSHKPVHLYMCHLLCLKCTLPSDPTGYRLGAFSFTPPHPPSLQSAHCFRNALCFSVVHMDLLVILLLLAVLKNCHLNSFHYCSHSPHFTYTQVITDHLIADSVSAFQFYLSQFFPFGTLLSF